MEGKIKLIEGIHFIQCDTHNDDRGSLGVIEGKKLPFKIKRVYYLYSTAFGERRGLHAHKKLEQILICVSGNCKIKLDNGREYVNILMDKPDIGLYISSAVWREMYDFSDDCVLVVLASEMYDESDYIRNYEVFKEYVNLRGNIK